MIFEVEECALVFFLVETFIILPRSKAGEHGP